MRRISLGFQWTSFVYAMANGPYRYSAGRIIVFAKEPVAGHVKTRLARDIGDEAALHIHQKMVNETIKMASQSALAKLELHVSGNLQHPLFQSIAEQQGIPVYLQQGSNLGEKMFSALNESLDNASYSVLIGTDCPVMSADYIEQAFHALDQGQDVVIGPAEDGGYVLIGASRVESSWFNNIDWGSQRVLEQSRQALISSAASFQELQPLWDIDHIGDLNRWRLCQ